MKIEQSYCIQSQFEYNIVDVNIRATSLCGLGTTHTGNVQ